MKKQCTAAAGNLLPCTCTKCTAQATITSLLELPVGSTLDLTFRSGRIENEYGSFIIVPGVVKKPRKGDTVLRTWFNFRGKNFKVERKQSTESTAHITAV